MVFCTNCGTKLTDELTACHNCGVCCSSVVTKPQVLCPNCKKNNMIAIESVNGDGKQTYTHNGLILRKFNTIRPNEIMIYCTSCTNLALIHKNDYLKACHDSNKAQAQNNSNYWWITAGIILIIMNLVVYH